MYELKPVVYDLPAINYIKYMIIALEALCLSSNEKRLLILYKDQRRV